ncbi:FtsX-like permease family protein [Nocardioides mangrovicus]|uniref:FtsX-like permease family protein n=1 Tax=Nocardioides mangrovicus TaxID=2478913 RepID=A0A3L8P0C7_9ACTN|nr:ABC transporter permease [Nocardioides mangrovicus]RLV48895.1 FtsX-like permease family protein [Nocardioides mangrovicus]
MGFTETLWTALDAIRNHRMRSILTMLGIVIGISSVVVTVGLGQGAQDDVRKEIASLGSNLLIVSPGSSTSSTGTRGGFGSSTTLTLSDADSIADSSVVPDVKRVAPVASTSVSLVNGSTNWTSQLVGTTSAWQQVRNRTLSAGRFFTAAEVASGANVTVLGSDTVSELFSGQSPVGQTVTVDGQQLTVIGVLKSSGTSSTSSLTGSSSSSSSTGSSDDDQAVVPITTEQRISGTTSTALSTVYVEAKSSATLSAAYQEIDSLLLNLHSITSSSDADFQIATQDSLLSAANSTNKTLTVLLAGVAAISLLVGGIGVMNIMLVSVTERIKEIGLRKALGATPSAIRRQFLLEASILGLLGGMIGAALGVGIAMALPSLISQSVTVSPVALGAAVGVALGLGVGFGVYPASRAAALTPIQALRSE